MYPTSIQYNQYNNPKIGICGCFVILTFIMFISKKQFLLQQYKDSETRSVFLRPVHASKNVKSAPIASKVTEIGRLTHVTRTLSGYKKIGRTSFDINHPTISHRFKSIDTSIAEETVKSLDFVIAAFPKTGTSTLMFWLGERSPGNIFVPQEEQCQFPGVRGGKATWGDNEASSLINGLIAHRIEYPDMIRGIKCPDMLENYLFTDVYSVFFPNTDIVIGIRHPVLWFQSYYNYRVLGLVNKGHSDFPNPNELMGSTQFDGVSGDRANFALPISKLGKTKLGPEELELLVSMTVVEKDDERKDAVIEYLKTVRSSRPRLGRVFLYDVGQLSDEHDSRATKFRSDFAAFLKLENALPPPVSANVNTFNSASYAKHKMDICEDVYTNLRSVLLQHGKEMSEWLIDYFLDSEDVIVSDQEHLINILRGYAVDPCQENFDMQG